MYVFLRYRLWGYKLPASVPTSVWKEFVGKHGMFQTHNLLAMSRQQTGSALNMINIVGQPMFISVEEVAHVEQVLTDKVGFANRGSTGFDWWVQPHLGLGL